MGRTVLDWLREMKPKPADDRPRCKRVELPGFWALPRRFGITYGCVEDGYVVAAGAAKGLHMRYRIVYDVGLWRQIERGRAELERMKNGGGVLQVVADAIYELAEKHEVGLERRCEYGMSGIPLRCKHYVLVDGVRVEAGVCGGAASHSECIKLILQQIERERVRAERERRKRLDYYL
jgi:hypothetical protein